MIARAIDLSRYRPNSLQTFADGGHRGPPAGGEPVPYWSDAIPQPDSSASVPPNPPSMHGWAANPYAMNSAPVEPTNLIENTDGSASATLTVPNNVTALKETIFCSISNLGVS